MPTSDIFAEKRSRLLREAGGDVLEVGGGTGLSLAHYPTGVRLTFTEPGPLALAEAVGSLEAPPGTAFMLGGLPLLPFADRSFDVVVVFRVLCSVPEPAAALAEVRRVLRPGGKVLFMEHSRSPRFFYGLWQDLIARPWHLYWRCWANRDVPRLLRRAGFEIDRMQWFGFGPPPVHPRVYGIARLPAG